MNQQTDDSVAHPFRTIQYPSRKPGDGKAYIFQQERKQAIELETVSTPSLDDNLPKQVGGVQQTGRPR